MLVMTVSAALVGMSGWEPAMLKTIGKTVATPMPTSMNESVAGIR